MIPASSVSGGSRFPPLIGVPVLGWAFGRQSALTWVAWALTAVVSVVLFKTPVGLRLRGVGEQPDAAETLGVDIVRYRVVTVLVAGALAGLAGAQLSLGAVSVFSEDMSAGRGWIAVVAVMLGRNNPLYAAGACVLFGFADALSVNLQSQGLPNQSDRHLADRDARGACHQPPPANPRRSASRGSQRDKCCPNARLNRRVNFKRGSVIKTMSRLRQRLPLRPVRKTFAKVGRRQLQYVNGVVTLLCGQRRSVAASRIVWIPRSV